jgi:putative secretion ATPase (PEP-CTERM system associated)
MYLEFFGLSEQPFQLTPDPAFLYLSKAHARAKAYMEFAVLNSDGFSVITGEIGSGKTLLVQNLISELEDNVTVARLYQTQLDDIELLRAVLAEFGIKAFRAKKAELLLRLKTFLIEQYKQGKSVILIVDEAQNLSLRTLEEVRLLTGLETEKNKILNIILVGQPELNDVLNSPHLEQLSQRIRLRFHITALSPDEAREYIYHRMAVAGGDGPTVFPEASMPLIYKYTGGVPRLLNILCDTSLLSAFVQERKVVDEDLLREAIEELQWVPFNERTHSRQIDLESDTGSHETGGKPKLVLNFNGSTLDEFPISKRLTTIGRKLDNDIHIDSRIVSRHHAQVKRLGNRCQLLDLNSRNGTLLNGESVQEADLKDGDVIAIGDHTLTFVVPKGKAGDGVEGERTGQHPELDFTDTIKMS